MGIEAWLFLQTVETNAHLPMMNEGKFNFAHLPKFCWKWRIQ